ncbi:MAG: HD domain-containing protein [Candidatus Acidulodesulfobacterium sp.]
MAAMITSTELKQKIKSKYSILKDDLLSYDSFHTAREISLFYDSVIIEAFSLISGGSDYCVIAGGSYSNLELCPYSDIDIMILTEDGLSREDSARDLKDFFYLFWDAGVDLAQSVMTSSEAIELMSSDLNTYTSFINARYITGNKMLFDKFISDFKKIEARFIFLKEIMKSLRKRRLINVMTDNDIFLLEPDVKETIGGLRDYSYCGWVYYLGVNDIFPSLSGSGEIFFKNPEETVIEVLKANKTDTSLKKEDITDLYNGKKFILKTRIMMHLIAGKKNDRLTFDVQENIANAFFYKDGKFLNKIEYFMHDYYLNAKNIHNISKLIINILIEPKILISKNKEKKQKEIIIENNFFLKNGLIAVKNKELFLSEEKNIFNLLNLYQTSGYRLNAESVNLLKIGGMKYAAKIKKGSVSKVFFINLLKNKKRVYQTLLLMHETKILTALIPEFEKIDSLSTNDVYHVYTVDAHSLNGIFYLENMANFKINTELKEIFEDLSPEDMLILNFSLLLHDIGKGYSAHHESIGSKIAFKISRRIGFDSNISDIVEFLILNHFVLPLTSERRDIHDPATIKYVAGIVKDIKSLKLLFIVSICDSMAVSKTRFNSWRKMLLVELYQRTLAYLKNTEEYFKDDLYYIGSVYEYAETLIGKKGYKFLENISNLKEFISEFINQFYSPSKYLARESKENILLHLKLFSKISDSHRFNFVAKMHQAEDYYEIVICGEDRKSIFSDITGVLSYFDFNILSADINTRKDGKFVDTFFVNHIYKKVDGDIDWHKLRKTFFNVFNGKEKLEEKLKNKRKNESLYAKSGPRVITSVEIYNNISDEFTVIEIQALDRKGLLHDIGKIFNSFNIDIFVSKITTQGNKAYDTFYVKNFQGSKIRNLLLMKKIKQTVQDML